MGETLVEPEVICPDDEVAQDFENISSMSLFEASMTFRTEKTSSINSPAFAARVVSCNPVWCVDCGRHSRAKAFSSAEGSFPRCAAARG